MADPNLTESAWQRAKVDAAGVYQSTAFQLGGALVTAIFGALALIAQEGQPTTTQVAVPILAAAVAILLSVIGVFACQLAAAPVRQRDELREAVDDPTVESVNVELTLRNQWRIGDDLHKKVSGSSMGYSTADAKRGEEWTAEVIEVLSEHVDETATRKFIEASRNIQGFPRQLRARLDALDEITGQVHEE